MEKCKGVEGNEEEEEEGGGAPSCFFAVPRRR
jgi:hypothetical protein